MCSGRARRMRACVCLVGALLAPAAPVYPQVTPGAPNLPTLGDTEREDLSPIMERKLGEQIMLDIARNRDYLDDDPTLEYLNEFGSSLVAARPGARGETGRDYFFFAVRDPQLNAFALPGGFIAVHSALLLAAQSESELAAVLSHEIGHVAQRHIARMLGQQRQDALIPLAALVLAVLAARANPDASMALLTGGQGLALQRQLSFSRDAEREADRVGFQIMGAAGMDTSGIVAFFGRMQAATRNYSDLTPAYLQSHPLTTERIADMQARIRDLPYKQRIDSLAFHLVRARARVLQDESVQGVREAAATFDTLRAHQGSQQKAAAQYGLAFLALRKGELVSAQNWLDAARKTALQDSSRTAVQASGEAIFTAMELAIKLAPGQNRDVARQALELGQRAHQQFPLSRGIARQLAEAMLAAGDSEQAARYLRDQVQLYRDEHKLHDLLAKTYSLQGKLALQHMALAESYVLTGSLVAALDQLGIARKAADASFYDMAIIDARERELQARVREAQNDGKDKKKEWSVRQGGAHETEVLGEPVAGDARNGQRTRCQL